jgi:voltage-gated potassium channel Kch
MNLLQLFLLAGGAHAVASKTDKPDIPVVHHDVTPEKKASVSIVFLLIAVLIVNTLFSTFAYVFLYGEIANAVTYIDYYYFGMITLATVGYGDMAPITQKARVAVTIYLYLTYTYMLSLAF